MSRPPGETLAPPSCLLLELTDCCNFSCRYCFVGAKPQHGARAYPTGVLDQILAFLLRTGRGPLLLSGGEPLMVPNFWEVVDAVAPRISTEILTNGSLLDGAAVRRFGAYERLRVSVSLDGAAASDHDRARGPGSFAAATGAVKRLTDAGLGGRVSIRMVMTEESIRCVPAMLRLVRDRGLSDLNANFVVSHGRSGAAPSRLPPVAAFRSVLAEILADPELRFLALTRSNLFALGLMGEAADMTDFPGCPFGESMRVDAAGYLYPCQDLVGESDRLGNVFEEDIGRVYRRSIPALRARVQESARRPSQMEECRQCVFLARCEGGCPARAKHSCGVEMNRDDLCELRKALLSAACGHFRSVATHCATAFRQGGAL